jgi:hypothetical protein
VYEQKQQLETLQARHGEFVMANGRLYFQDGHEVEWSDTYGARELGEQPPERRREAAIFYWRQSVEKLTGQFHEMREGLAFKAKTAILTPADTTALRALQQKVQAAAKQLDLLEHPPGPDPREVKRARKLLIERAQLAADCGQAEKAYKAEEKRAGGRQSQKLTRLGEQWQSAWEVWDAANQRYQAIDGAVRKEAENEIYAEEREAKRRAQELELSEIEI